MGLDNATVAAVAALAVAAVALIVAFAQVTQQYLGTGQLLRVCDSTVFGHLPGGGHRLWVRKQFRFRVVYSLPRIELLERFWPRTGVHTPSNARGRYLFPDLKRKWIQEPITWDNWYHLLRKRRPRRVRRAAIERLPGEASWVSFIRTIQPSAQLSIRYSLVENDVDRCPSDLPVVPMPVSLRDIIVLAISAGMRITYASFKDKTISMQGFSGTITSSQHPVLGALIHFTPIDFGKPLELRRTSSLDQSWVARMWGTIYIAGRPYGWKEQRNIERLERLWESSSKPGYDHDPTNADRGLRTTGYGDRNHPAQQQPSSRYAFVGSDLPFGARIQTDRPIRSRDVSEINFNMRHRDHVPKGPYDGDWWFVRKEQIEFGTNHRHIRQNVPHAPTSSTIEYEYSGYPIKNHRCKVIFNNARKYWRRLRSSQAVWVDTLEIFNIRHDGRGSVDGTVSHLDSVSISGSQELQSAEDNDPTYPQNTVTSIRASGEVQSRHGAAESQSSLRPSHVPLPSSIASSKVTLETAGSDDESFEIVSLDSEEAIPFPPDPFPKESEPLRLDQRSTDSAYGSSARWSTAQESQRARKEAASNEQEDLSKLHKWKATLQRQPHLLRYHQPTVEEDYEDSRQRAGQDSDEDHHGSEEDTRGTANANADGAASAAAQEAARRQAERERQRAQRDRDLYERRSRRKRRATPDCSWFWASQMDIYPGYWATDYAGDFSPQTCIGAIAVLIEALMGHTQKRKTLCYVPSFGHQRMIDRTREWHIRANETYPGYAINSRGGVVVAGVYTPVQFPQFEADLPPIELAADYKYQVDEHSKDNARDILLRNMELMSLDSWLSLASRTNEIFFGKANLTRTAPKLIHLILDDFEEDFEAIDRDADEGGLQLISDIAANLMDRLDDEKLDQAEQLFMLVAMLRTVKVAACICNGIGTDVVQDILLSDIQVHFV